MRNIAHRGASGYAPENTRAAFDLAIRMGADAIETDVQLTADGVPVVFHDDRVDRTSDETGPLASYDLATLRALDVGSWFGGGQGPERVLTLADLLAEYGSRIPLAVEVKDPRAAEATVRALAASDARWELTSFSWGALLDARRLAPDATLGFLSPVFDPDIVARCVAAGFRQVCPPAARLDAGLVDLAHRAGLEVRAWAVRDRDDVATLFRTGADGATVNWPDWVPEYRAANP